MGYVPTRRTIVLPQSIVMPLAYLVEWGAWLIRCVIHVHDPLFDLRLTLDRELGLSRPSRDFVSGIDVRRCIIISSERVVYFGTSRSWIWRKGSREWLRFDLCLHFPFEPAMELIGCFYSGGRRLGKGWLERHRIGFGI